MKPPPMEPKQTHKQQESELNQKKIDRHLVYIEERTQEYLADHVKMIYRIIHNH
jgi:hypothetical protein